MSWSFKIPLKIINHSNSGEHWQKRKKRVDLHRLLVSIYWVKSGMPKIPLPCTVTLTRSSAKVLDPDNLQSAFKTIRDEVSDKLVPGKAKGHADADPRITWHYKQQSAKVSSITVQIEENQLDMFE